MRAGTTLFAVPMLLSFGGCDDPKPGGRLYLGSGLTDQVFVLDAADGRLLDTLSLNPRRGEMDEPHGLAVAPDGRHWYASVSHGEPTLWKFEAEGDRLVGRLRLGLPGAGRVGVSPDGTRAVVPDYWRTGQGRETHVSLVTLHDLTETGTLQVCPAPHDAQFDPSGRWVAVTCSLSDELVILDADADTVKARFPVDPDPGPPGAPRFRPLNAVWTDDGGRVVATLAAANEVRAFRPDGELVARTAVGAMPTQLAVLPGGGSLVVVNRVGRSLSVLEAQTLDEVRRIPLTELPNPHGVALGPNGRIAYVSYEGAVEGAGGAAAVDLETGSVSWVTPAGAYTLGIAYRAAR